MAVRLIVYGSARASVRLSGSTAVRQCAAVRAAVCSSAHVSVCAVCAAVCGMPHIAMRLEVHVSAGCSVRQYAW
jgi:hypothetical protein